MGWHFTVLEDFTIFLLKRVLIANCFKTEPDGVIHLRNLQTKSEIGFMLPSIRQKFETFDSLDVNSRSFSYSFSLLVSALNSLVFELSGQL